LVTGHPDAARVSRCNDIRFGVKTGPDGPETPIPVYPRQRTSSDKPSKLPDSDISTVPFEERSFKVNAAVAILGISVSRYFELIAAKEIHTYKEGRSRMITGRANNAYREKRARETKEASSVTPCPDA